MTETLLFKLQAEPVTILIVQVYMPTWEYKDEVEEPYV